MYVYFISGAQLLACKELSQLIHSKENTKENTKESSWTKTAFLIVTDVLPLVVVFAAAFAYYQHRKF